MKAAPVCSLGFPAPRGGRSDRPALQSRIYPFVIATIFIVATMLGCAKGASVPAASPAAAAASAKVAPLAVVPSAIVILIREAVSGATAEAPAEAPASAARQTAAGKGKAATYELRTIPEGKQSLSQRAQILFTDTLASRKVDAMVIQPAHAGIAEAIHRSRSADSATLWILARPGDSALAVESEADLAVEVGGIADGQELDPDLDAALSRGLCELARRARMKGLRVDDRAVVKAALDSVGGYEWAVDYRVDPDTGVKAKAHVVATPQPRG